MLFTQDYSLSEIHWKYWHRDLSWTKWQYLKRDNGSRSKDTDIYIVQAFTQKRMNASLEKENSNKCYYHWLYAIHKYLCVLFFCIEWNRNDAILSDQKDIIENIIYWKIEKNLLKINVFFWFYLNALKTLNSSYWSKTLICKKKQQEWHQWWDSLCLIISLDRNYKNVWYILSNIDTVMPLNKRLLS